MQAIKSCVGGGKVTTVLILTLEIDGKECPDSRSRRFYSKEKRFTLCIEPETEKGTDSNIILK